MALRENWRRLGRKSELNAGVSKNLVNVPFVMSHPKLDVEVRKVSENVRIVSRDASITRHPDEVHFVNLKVK